MRHITPALSVVLLLGSCKRAEPDDLEKSVASYGLDYARLKENARRSPEGLRGFLLLSRVLDTAPADAYSYDMGKLLEDWGDAPFAEIVDSLRSPLREDVLGTLAYESAYRECEAFWRGVAARYPRVARMIETRGVNASSPRS